MTELSSVSSISPSAQLSFTTLITASEFNGLLVTEISTLRKFARKFSNDQQEINDLVQDTLVSALRFWDKFKPETSIKAWLFVILKNTYINSYRKILHNRSIFDQNEAAGDYSLYSSNRTENPNSRLSFIFLSKCIPMGINTGKLHNKPVCLWEL